MTRPLRTRSTMSCYRQQAIAVFLHMPCRRGHAFRPHHHVDGSQSPARAASISLMAVRLRGRSSPSMRLGCSPEPSSGSVMRLCALHRGRPMVTRQMPRRFDAGCTLPETIVGTSAALRPPRRASKGGPYLSVCITSTVISVLTYAQKWGLMAQPGMRFSNATTEVQAVLRTVRPPSSMARSPRAPQVWGLTVAVLALPGQEHS